MNLKTTTELEAVNTMLRIIGNSPINTLNETELFNNIEAFEINRDATTNNVFLPDNTLRVRSWDINERYIQKGNKLYNRIENTFKFEENPIVELTTLEAFEDLPEPARYYILIRSSRKLQTSVVGSQTLFGFTLQEEEMAQQNLEAFDSEIDRFNLFTEDGDLTTLTNR
jgi:hypothetical protein